MNVKKIQQVNEPNTYHRQKINIPPNNEILVVKIILKSPENCIN